jgi:hypothetical protein
MQADLKDQIHMLMERGIQRVSADDIAGRASAGQSPFPAKRAWLSSRSRQATAIAAGVAAVACASAVAATQLGGPASPVKAGLARKAPVALTAAMLSHVASASRPALAHAGRAVVYSRETQDGVLQQTGTDDISFTGRNWNDSFTVVTPASAGQPASSESAINRVVNGRAYDYFVAADGLAWYHDTGPDAVSNLAIPDPRKLLSELAPAARFVAVGKSMLDGVAVTQLKATAVRGLPALNSPNIWPAGSVTALSVWVDGSGVVRQVTVTGTQTARVGQLAPGADVRRKLTEFLAGVRTLEKREHLSPAQAIRREKFSVLGGELRKHHIMVIRNETQVTSMTIRFTDIGQPQVIGVPPGAIPVYGPG